MTFLAVVSSPLPSSHVIVYPVFFLLSATKKINFIRVHGVTRGGPPPRPLAVRAQA